jgi:hypothetical protein
MVWDVNYEYRQIFLLYLHFVHVKNSSIRISEWGALCSMNFKLDENAGKSFLKRGFPYRA